MGKLLSIVTVSTKAVQRPVHEGFRFLALVIGLAITSLISVAHANEVGDRVLVVEPKAKPLYVSNSGGRYWACAGMVNKGLLDAIYNDLVFMSKQDNLPNPEKSLCLYSISEMKLMGNAITTYAVDYYVSTSSMEACLTKDYCSDFRSVIFKVKDGELFRTYNVTSASKKISRFACTKLDGTVVSLDKACP